MIPLQVTAHMHGGVTMRESPIALDGLLAWAVAMQRELPPPGFGPLVEVEIPIMKEPGGRFHLSTSAICEWDQFERRFVNRKFPIPEAQMMADDKLKRIHIGAGPQKSYRIPTEVGFPENDRIDWYAIGAEAEVRELLSWVTHLGKRRAVGRGRVREWIVAPCEPWGDGFPIVRDGRAMRNLPHDWPGLTQPVLAEAALTYPYWERTKEQLCAVPG